MNQKQKGLTPKLVKTLYHDVDHQRLGNQFSRQHRNSMITTTDNNEDTKSLTYGEIHPESFVQMLELAIKNLPIGTPLRFCDLGSGTRKAVLSAALCGSFGFIKVMGIEIVPALDELAHSARDTLLSALTDGMNNRQFVVSNSAKPVRKIVSGVSTSEFLNRIVTIIIDCGSPTVSIEDIGNKLVQQMGHKTYTATLKPFGKLSRCIAQQLDRFVVLDDGMVSLVAVDIASTTAEETSETTLTTQSDCNNNPTTITSEEPLSSLSVSDTLSSIFQQHSGSAKTYHTLLPEIEFLCGDIFDSVKWQNDYNIVYTASLLFSEEMMERLLVCVRGLSPPAVFITLKPLPLSASDKQFIRLFEDSFFKMSWQLAKVYFYLISSPTAGEKSIT